MQQPPRSVSFRQQIHGEIADFLEAGAMSCAKTATAMVQLVEALAHYTEEGRVLFPRVVICDDLRITLRLLQGRDPIRVGDGPREVETARQALKRCAPLATGGWSIYIERLETDRFSFGLFREPNSPTALDLRATMANLDAGDAKIVLVHQLGPRVVELVSPGGRSLQVHVSAARHDSKSRFDALGRFAEISTEGLAEPQRETATSFLRTTLSGALRGSHGALIALVAAGSRAPLQLMSDCVALEHPIDLGALVVTHVTQQSADSFGSLLAYGGLLGGMLACDGITVITTDLKVIAYNAFVPIAHEPDGSPREQLGGARRRAFSMLIDLVNRLELRAAYFRSSDGTTDLTETVK